METYDSVWVSTQIAQAMEIWHGCASETPWNGREYSASEQDGNERAYDEALFAVEQDLQQASDGNCERAELRERIVASFATFSARALHLEGDAIDLLTNEFLPVGTQLAQFARHHYPGLEMGGVIQAARNAWTACGLQPLLGARVRLTPSILGYSLLYPFSDNLLDDVAISTKSKLQFSARFRTRLAGGRVTPVDERDRAIGALISLIEMQYPREGFPQVFECLLAIHQAQEISIGQLAEDAGDILGLSFAKGGTSVLADACLTNGALSGAESRFAFLWGILLQLGDDLQDLQDDMRRGSKTLFADAAASGVPLDRLAAQLLSFSEAVGACMDELPQGTPTLKGLLKMSWRSLITRAIADSHEFFSNEFLGESERGSPFRFAFLRARRDRLASRQGLYETLFDALLDDRVDVKPLALAPAAS